MLLHPTPPPHAHPTKPLRAFSENENLRGVQAKMLYVENFTGSPVNPPPENRPKCPKRKIHLPTINLHGAIWVFPTKMVPQIMHFIISIGFSIIFTIHFGGFTTPIIFWGTHPYAVNVVRVWPHNLVYMSPVLTYLLGRVGHVL